MISYLAALASRSVISLWNARGNSAVERINFRLRGGLHLDERRPGAFEAFAGNFLRRVYAEFGADGDFARGVVEHVGIFHFFTKGLRTLSCRNAEKSRPADQSSLPP